MGSVVGVDADGVQTAQVRPLCSGVILRGIKFTQEVRICARSCDRRRLTDYSDTTPSLRYRINCTRIWHV
jgi:hypothetical protein